MSKLILIFILLFSTTSFSLSVHSIRRFAHKALLITSNRAREAISYMSHIPPTSEDLNEINDCRAMLDRAVDRLERSITEMIKLGAYGSATYEMHVSNVKTWVSAAMTEQDMCLEGLRRARFNGKVIKSVVGMVARVRKFTLDALSLVNRL